MALTHSWVAEARRVENAKAIARRRFGYPGIAVVCQECGYKFTTHKDIPECGRCGSIDIEVK